MTSTILQNRKGKALGLSLLLALMAGMLFAQAAPTTVTMTMTPTDKAKYLRFMSGKAPTDKISYQSADLDSAVVVDAVLITKALALGGLKATIQIVEVPNSERDRITVLDGTAVVSGTSQWDFFVEENKDAVYRSDVVVPNGSFEKGFYTTKELLGKITIKSLADLSNLNCVSCNTWRVDWATLQAMPFKQLSSSPTRESMFKLVSAGRVDVTVQSFSGTPDMSITDGGVTLYPIQGVKVLLNGARHYMVSKKHPDGAAVFAALQKGLAIMKQDNEVGRALVESGFFNKNVKTWTALK